jgi:phosphatidylserine decarboxylase
MSKSSTIIAVEGFPFIAYAAVIAIFLAVASWLLSSAILAIPAVIAVLLLVFVISFFRNPERVPPEDTALVIAPADGTVVYAGPSHQEHLGDCLKISIFMSVFNVHINRSPMTGKVIDCFYLQGKFYDARDERASCENEQCGVVLESASGVKIAFVQIAGLIARRIICYAEKGDLLERGKRYGLIRFGSRVDVYLPAGLQPLVAVGEKTVAGVTPLVRLGEPV